MCDSIVRQTDAMWFEMNLGREMAVAPSQCLFLYRSKSPHNVSFFATPVAVTSWGVCCDTIRRLRLGFRTGPLSDPHCSLTDPWGGAFRENLSFDSGIAPERLQRVLGRPQYNYTHYWHPDKPRETERRRETKGSRFYSVHQQPDPPFVDQSRILAYYFPPLRSTACSQHGIRYFGKVARGV